MMRVHRTVRPEVEAELALAELAGLEWKRSQTKILGCTLAYTLIGDVINLPATAHVTLYLPDGQRVIGPAVGGVTERELQYKALVWAIGKVLDTQAATRRTA